jgi:hypothetical protein
MFGLHKHKYKIIGSYRIDERRWGVQTKSYLVYVQQCEVCGKIKKQKVVL